MARPPRLKMQAASKRRQKGAEPRAINATAAMGAVRDARAALVRMLDAAGTPIQPVVISHALVLLLERAAHMTGQPVDPQLVGAAHGTVRRAGDGRRKLTARSGAKVRNHD